MMDVEELDYWGYEDSSSYSEPVSSPPVELRNLVNSVKKISEEK